MSRLLKLALVATIAVLSATVVPASAAHKDRGTTYYRADLGMLNDSGVTGTATVQVKGNRLTVTVEASGLEAGMVHPQHIHGFDDTTDATCPTLAQDDNGNGLIEIAEGADTYGPVQLALMPFPTAEDGTVSFTETYKVTGQDVRDLRNLEDELIVLHGKTVDGEYWASLPVACGTLEPAPQS